MEFNFSSAAEAQRFLEIHGSSPIEIFSLTFFVPMCSLLIWLSAEVVHISDKSIQFFELFSLNIILLLALTVLEQHLQLLFIILWFLIFILFYIVILKHVPDKMFNYVLKDVTMPKRNISKDFVGGYRGHLLLATGISILAVDFNIFPSRFAKTDTYGWSMMDAGVGSFVLLHGLCSSHGKNAVSNRHGLKKCFLSAFPLFLLGFIRLVVTSAVGYHKVVSEYGVHWNFFFTLAFTKVICYCVLSKIQLPCGIMAITTAIVHQLLLSKAGLSYLVLSDARSTFFEANKEGICSLLGFVTIYFCGVQLGQIVWKQGYKMSDYMRLLLKLCLIGLIAWILMYPFHITVQPVSRRMANLPYCIWVVSLTSLQLAVHLSQEILIIVLSKVLKNNYCEFLLWKAINYNGLFYFLLANLLTGVVNLLINTSKSPDLKSFIILIIYLTFLTASSVISYCFSIQLKFW